MLFRTRRSRPVIDASASAAPGRGIGGGLERRGVGRCDDAGVVPGVDDGGRVELYVSADEGMSESVSVGDRWRSCSAGQSAKDIHRGLQVDKYRRRWCREGGETRVWSRMRSLRLAIAGAVTSKSSRIRRFSRSRPPSAGAGASSACACASVRFFFPLLDARSSSYLRRRPLAVSVDRRVLFFSASPASVKRSRTRSWVLAEGGSQAAFGGRTRSRARVGAATTVIKAAPSPRYLFFILFQQKLIDVDLDSWCDRRLEDGVRRE
jgi:hypothetical protein